MSRSAVQEFANSTTAQVALAGAMILTPFAANAQSVTFISGQCYDSAATQTQLKQMGQKMIFTGTRNTDNNPTNIITLADNGYGYNFELEKATEPGKKDELCLKVAVKNPQFGDPKSDKAPEWSKVIKDFDGISVSKVYANQGRLMFGAETYTIGAKGQEIPGKAFAIVAFPEKKIGAAWTVDSKGIPEGLYEFSSIKYIESNFNYFAARAAAASMADATPPKPNNGPVVAMRSLDRQ